MEDKLFNFLGLAKNLVSTDWLLFHMLNNACLHWALLHLWLTQENVSKCKEEWILVVLNAMDS